ncbi:hypothetical protein CAP36_09640 [Chitinophagaceae bacterium IBVUCB2]|nr:hypothetical protein CAP36_09640 [Chitinophagaceae bacterium IBVUCB2]
MKKIWTITGCVALMAVLISCNKTRRSEGRAYMPDMAYSRAYETYSSTENLKEKGINYTSMPVAGTIARGDAAGYTLKNDSTGYAASAANKNPFSADSIDMKEAERLYLINCGICHGAKLDGNGPLWNGGDGPYPAAPRNLITDPITANMSEGTMFHSVTYGRNSMGSYASQLTTKQRWEVVAYIKSKQGTASAAKPAADTATAAMPKK